MLSSSIFFDTFKLILGSFFSFFFCIFSIVLGLAFLFFICFCFKIHFNFNPHFLKECHLKYKYFDLLRWLLYDFLTRKQRKDIFKPFGFSFFIGRQGSGKTISMVKYLKNVREKYPNCVIVTNFYCKYADCLMKDWRDLFDIRNGDNGVVFAIDEIHSEYSSAMWRDFPENLLSEISQQRKQKVKIIASSQVLSRVAKPLREQAFSVFVCDTYLNRFTKCIEYDYHEFSSIDENAKKIKEKIRSLSKFSFVQSDEIREAYDTYEKIERMKKIEFIPRNER